MIKIGIIGMSPGNAHPYSWSAIINGCFDAEEINQMGYPAVSNYLEANKDTIGINGAKVTCVWTQDKKISESIAKTAQIETNKNTDGSDGKPRKGRRNGLFNKVIHFKIY